ncbi:MAG TPA: cation:proton antiporter [Pseudonocardiaceae bacterium]|nr:cation:proton antiporter [Pseudonocardiaceae bacterium]
MTIAAPYQPLSQHQLLIFLLEVAALLALAFCLGRLAVRFKMPAIVGELMAGVIVGPSLLGWLAPGFANWLMPADPKQMHLLEAAGQIGVLLLVGVTGSHFDLAMLRRKRATAARISITGLIIPLALGIGLGLLLPATLLAPDSERSVFALFLGVAMCVTAIPVIAKTLSDMKLLHRDVGQLTLAAGLVDDAVGWLLLSIASALATVGVTMGLVSLAVAKLVGFVLVAFLVGRPIVRWLMRLADRSGQSGPTVAVAVITILFSAAATQALHLEAIFGAFIAGIMIGAPGVVDRRKLAPLTSVVLWVLAPLFLAGAGLRMDLTSLVNPTTALAAVAILSVAIVGKFAGAYLGARMSKLGHWEGLAMGAGMNARGVVEVVIAFAGLRLGVLTTATYTCIVLVAIVTSLMAPPVLRLAMSKVAQNDDEQRRLIEHEKMADVQLEPTPPPLRSVA